MIDAQAFGAELAAIVKAHVSPLMAEIAALKKQIAEAPVPKDGKDADPIEVAAIVSADLRKDIAALREVVESIPEIPELPELPEFPELPDIPALVDVAVKAAVAAIPAPEPGKDGAPGADGTSIAAEDVLPALVAHIDEHLASLPVPKDGEPGKDGLDGEKGDDGEDGAGIADLLIDRNGALVATMTDGRIKHLGPVIGKDGDPGRDGLDGVGFDDMAAEFDGERTLTLRWTKGEKVVERTLTFPVVLDRGVYAAGKDYQTGDAVTFGGSLWIAQEPTNERPDGGKGWRLGVKKGRDGKDGEMKSAPESKPVKVG